MYVLCNQSSTYDVYICMFVFQNLNSSPTLSIIFLYIVDLHDTGGNTNTPEHQNQQPKEDDIPAWKKLALERRLSRRESQDMSNSLNQNVGKEEEEIPSWKRLVNERRNSKGGSKFGSPSPSRRVNDRAELAFSRSDETQHGQNSGEGRSKHGLESRAMHSTSTPQNLQGDGLRGQNIIAGHELHGKGVAVGENSFSAPGVFDESIVTDQPGGDTEITSLLMNSRSQRASLNGSGSRSDPSMSPPDNTGDVNTQEELSGNDLGGVGHSVGSNMQTPPVSPVSRKGILKRQSHMYPGDEKWRNNEQEFNTYPDVESADAFGSDSIRGDGLNKCLTKTGPQEDIRIDEERQHVPNEDKHSYGKHNSPGSHSKELDSDISTSRRRSSDLKVIDENVTNEDQYKSGKRGSRFGSSDELKHADENTVDEKHIPGKRGSSQSHSVEHQSVPSIKPKFSSDSTADDEISKDDTEYATGKHSGQYRHSTQHGPDILQRVRDETAPGNDDESTFDENQRTHGQHSRRQSHSKQSESDLSRRRMGSTDFEQNYENAVTIRQQESSIRDSSSRPGNSIDVQDAGEGEQDGNGYVASRHYNDSTEHKPDSSRTSGNSKDLQNGAQKSHDEGTCADGKHSSKQNQAKHQVSDVSARPRRSSDYENPSDSVTDQVQHLSENHGKPHLPSVLETDSSARPRVSAGLSPTDGYKDVEDMSGKTRHPHSHSTQHHSVSSTGPRSSCDHPDDEENSHHENRHTTERQRRRNRHSMQKVPDSLNDSFKGVGGIGDPENTNENSIGNSIHEHGKYDSRQGHPEQQGTGLSTRRRRSIDFAHNDENPSGKGQHESERDEKQHKHSMLEPDPSASPVGSNDLTTVGGNADEGKHMPGKPRRSHNHSMENQPVPSSGPRYSIDIQDNGGNHHGKRYAPGRPNKRDSFKRAMAASDDLENADENMFGESKPTHDKHGTQKSHPGQQDPKLSVGRRSSDFKYNGESSSDKDQHASCEIQGKQHKRPLLETDLPARPDHTAAGGNADGGKDMPGKPRRSHSHSKENQPFSSSSYSTDHLGDEGSDNNENRHSADRQNRRDSFKRVTAASGDLENTDENMFSESKRTHEKRYSQQSHPEQQDHNLSQRRRSSGFKHADENSSYKDKYLSERHDKQRKHSLLETDPPARPNSTAADGSADEEKHMHGKPRRSYSHSKENQSASSGPRYSTDLQGDEEGRHYERRHTPDWQDKKDSPKRVTASGALVNAGENICDDSKHRHGKSDGQQSHLEKQDPTLSGRRRSSSIDHTNENFADKVPGVSEKHGRQNQEGPKLLARQRRSSGFEKTDKTTPGEERYASGKRGTYGNRQSHTEAQGPDGSRRQRRPRTAEHTDEDIADMDQNASGKHGAQCEYSMPQEPDSLVMLKGSVDQQRHSEQCYSDLSARPRSSGGFEYPEENIAEQESNSYRKHESQHKHPMDDAPHSSARHGSSIALTDENNSDDINFVPGRHTGLHNRSTQELSPSTPHMDSTDKTDFDETGHGKSWHSSGGCGNGDESSEQQNTDTSEEHRMPHGHAYDEQSSDIKKHTEHDHEAKSPQLDETNEHLIDSENRRHKTDRDIFSEEKPSDGTCNASDGYTSTEPKHKSGNADHDNGHRPSTDLNFNERSYQINRYRCNIDHNLEDEHIEDEGEDNAEKYQHNSRRRSTDHELRNLYGLVDMPDNLDGECGDFSDEDFIQRFNNRRRSSVDSTRPLARRGRLSFDDPDMLSDENKFSHLKTIAEGQNLNDKATTERHRGDIQSAQYFPETEVDGTRSSFSNRRSSNDDLLPDTDENYRPNHRRRSTDHELTHLYGLVDMPDNSDEEHGDVDDEDFRQRFKNRRKSSMDNPRPQTRRGRHSIDNPDILSENKMSQLKTIAEGQNRHGVTIGRHSSDIQSDYLPETDGIDTRNRRLSNNDQLQDENRQSNLRRRSTDHELRNLYGLVDMPDKSDEEYGDFDDEDSRPQFNNRRKSSVDLRPVTRRGRHSLDDPDMLSGENKFSHLKTIAEGQNTKDVITERRSVDIQPEQHLSETDHDDRSSFVPRRLSNQIVPNRMTSAVGSSLPDDRDHSGGNVSPDTEQSTDTNLSRQKQTFPSVSYVEDHGVSEPGQHEGTVSDSDDTNNSLRENRLSGTDQNLADKWSAKSGNILEQSTSCMERRGHESDNESEGLKSCNIPNRDVDNEPRSDIDGYGYSSNAAQKEHENWLRRERDALLRNSPRIACDQEGNNTYDPWVKIPGDKEASGDESRAVDMIENRPINTDSTGLLPGSNFPNSGYSDSNARKSGSSEPNHRDQSQNSQREGFHDQQQKLEWSDSTNLQTTEQQAHGYMERDLQQNPIGGNHMIGDNRNVDRRLYQSTDGVSTNQDGRDIDGRLKQTSIDIIFMGGDNDMYKHMQQGTISDSDTEEHSICVDRYKQQSPIGGSHKRGDIGHPDRHLQQGPINDSHMVGESWHPDRFRQGGPIGGSQVVRDDGQPGRQLQQGPIDGIQMVEDSEHPDRHLQKGSIGGNQVIGDSRHPDMHLLQSSIGGSHMVRDSRHSGGDLDRHQQQGPVGGSRTAGDSGHSDRRLQQGPIGDSHIAVDSGHPERYLQQAPIGGSHMVDDNGHRDWDLQQIPIGGGRMLGDNGHPGMHQQQGPIGGSHIDIDSRNPDSHLQQDPIGDRHMGADSDHTVRHIQQGSIGGSDIFEGSEHPDRQPQHGPITDSHVVGGSGHLDRHLQQGPIDDRYMVGNSGHWQQGPIGGSHMKGDSGHPNRYRGQSPIGGNHMARDSGHADRYLQQGPIGGSHVIGDSEHPDRHLQQSPVEGSPMVRDSRHLGGHPDKHLQQGTSGGSHMVGERGHPERHLQQGPIGGSDMVGESGHPDRHLQRGPIGGRHTGADRDHPVRHIQQGPIGNSDILEDNEHPDRQLQQGPIIDSHVVGGNGHLDRHLQQGPIGGSHMVGESGHPDRHRQQGPIGGCHMIGDSGHPDRHLQQGHFDDRHALGESGHPNRYRQQGSIGDNHMAGDNGHAGRYLQQGPIGGSHVIGDSGHPDKHLQQGPIDGSHMIGDSGHLDRHLQQGLFEGSHVVEGSGHLGEHPDRHQQQGPVGGSHIAGDNGYPGRDLQQGQIGGMHIRSGRHPDRHLQQGSIGDSHEIRDSRHPVSHLQQDSIGGSHMLGDSKHPGEHHDRHQQKVTFGGSHMARGSGHQDNHLQHDPIYYSHMIGDNGHPGMQQGFIDGSHMTGPNRHLQQSPIGGSHMIGDSRHPGGHQDKYQQQGPVGSSHMAGGSEHPDNQHQHGHIGDSRIIGDNGHPGRYLQQGLVDGSHMTGDSGHPERHLQQGLIDSSHMIGDGGHSDRQLQQGHVDGSHVIRDSGQPERHLQPGLIDGTHMTGDSGNPNRHLQQGPIGGSHMIGDSGDPNKHLQQGPIDDSHVVIDSGHPDRHLQQGTIGGRHIVGDSGHTGKHQDRQQQQGPFGGSYVAGHNGHPERHLQQGAISGSYMEGNSRHPGKYPDSRQQQVPVGGSNMVVDSGHPGKQSDRYQQQGPFDGKHMAGDNGYSDRQLHQGPLGGSHMGGDSEHLDRHQQQGHVDGSHMQGDSGYPSRHRQQGTIGGIHMVGDSGHPHRRQQQGPFGGNHLVGDSGNLDSHLQQGPIGDSHMIGNNGYPYSDLQAGLIDGSRMTGDSGHPDRHLQQGPIGGSHVVGDSQHRDRHLQQDPMGHMGRSHGRRRWSFKQTSAAEPYWWQWYGSRWWASKRATAARPCWWQPCGRRQWASKQEFAARLHWWQSYGWRW